MVNDFVNEERQVRAGKRQARRGDAVMFYIRMNVLVMRMSARQSWIIGVLMRIIPIKFILALPDFVAIAKNLFECKVKTLAHEKANVSLKEQFAN